MGLFSGTSLEFHFSSVRTTRLRSLAKIHFGSRLPTKRTFGLQKTDILIWTLNESDSPSSFQPPYTCLCIVPLNQIFWPLPFLDGLVFLGRTIFLLACLQNFCWNGHRRWFELLCLDHWSKVAQTIVKFICFTKISFLPIWQAANNNC